MRVTIHDLQQMKERGERIAMLTAYDYSTARLLDEAGVPLILVGDSLGMVMLGYDTTLPVTVDMMVHHIRAVVRGTKQALVVGDMPFMSYQTGVSDALRNAGRFLQEAGCQAVKLEGGETMAETVRRLVEVGIPVQGHIGFTPQSVNQLGLKVQGRSKDLARRLLNDAICLQQAGAFSIVLEMVPAPLAGIITRRVKVPTIGIGAGPSCDGQVLVCYDLLGMSLGHRPKFAKAFAELGDAVQEAARRFVGEVRHGAFPAAEHCYAPVVGEAGPAPRNSEVSGPASKTKLAAV